MHEDKNDKESIPKPDPIKENSCVIYATPKIKTSYWCRKVT